MDVKQENGIKMLVFRSIEFKWTVFGASWHLKNCRLGMFRCNSTPNWVDGKCFDVMFIKSITFAILSSTPLAMYEADVNKIKEAIEFVNIQLWPEETFFYCIAKLLSIGHFTEWEQKQNGMLWREKMKNVFSWREKSYKKHIRRT